MNNVRFAIAQADQKEAITNFLLEYFLVEEPMNRAIKMTKDDAKNFFTDLVSDGLVKPVSFLALNEKNEVIGCRLNEIVDIDSSDRPQSIDTDRYSDAAKKIITLLDIVKKDTDQLLPPETKRIMKFIIVSVHPDYQRRGIAKELVERSMRLAAEQGCDYVWTAASAMRSQNLFEKKLGFETLRTVNYSGYRDPITNQQIINCDDGSICVKVMVKKLR